MLTWVPGLFPYEFTLENPEHVFYMTAHLKSGPESLFWYIKSKSFVSGPQQKKLCHAPVNLVGI